MDREQFKAAYRAARLTRYKGTQSIEGLVFGFNRIHRQDIVPKVTYWNLFRHADSAKSKSDKRFYLQRARAIRKGQYKDNWAGC